MNILFLDAYYEPEKIAYTHLEKDLVEGLVNSGHNVSIICPIPTRGISKEIKDTYKSIKRETKYDGKVNITRFWAPQEGRKVVIRAFRYFWCNLRTYQIAVKYRNVDIVFSNSTPPTQGMLSAKVAKKIGMITKKKVPFIYNLQDIFPDSLINTNLTKKGSLIWKIGRKIENYTYKEADKIILISQRFKKNLLNKGVNENKIEVISNWIDLSSVYPVKRNDNKLINEFQLDPNKFIVVYAGNFGASQGADIVLKVAKELQIVEDIQFVIFGGGAYFEEAKVEALELRNVFIHELMPSERISEVYSLGDIALITCRAGTGRAGMPSKLWSIMACDTPIIASFDSDSDLADVINDAKSGIVVEPERIDELKIAIEQVYNKKYEFGEFRSYTSKNASKNECVDKYLRCIEDLKRCQNENLNN